MLPKLRFPRLRPPAATGPLAVEIDGVTLPVTVRRHARARRLTLRIDRDGRGLTVTVPPVVPARDIAGFLAKQRDWIARRRATLSAAIPFEAGAVLPILGDPTEIVHRLGRPAAPRLVDSQLIVGGEPDHVARRVRDYLVGRARSELSQRALGFAAELQVRPAGISVRDSTSRWGSCSSARRLSFSWRLVMAPVPVVDYVAAHEVAHLVEMNHGPRFWALVARLTPEADAARGWLKAHGAALYRYGALAA